MEPIDTNDYNRHDALAAAVQYHSVREATPDDVVDTASIFLAWLNNYKEDA